MLTLLELVAILMNLAVLPYFLLLLAVSVSAILVRRPIVSAGEPRSRFLIVIPAHNEENDVSDAIVSCQHFEYPTSLFEILVIADNCTDRTASVAVASRARVMERFDAEKKSKGFALEYLIAELKRSGEFERLDALVIVDADTTVDPNLLLRFDHALVHGRDWVQAYYTVANPEQSWRTRLMKYAFALFNGVMLLGLNGLGVGAGFRGNGMCLSTRGLKRVPWACHGLVEDLEFSWVLRIAGEWIQFERDVWVEGAMLSSGGTAAANQRKRWEFGRAGIRKKYLMPILRSDKASWREKLVLACELTLPPLSSMVLIALTAIGINAAVFASATLHNKQLIPALLLAASILIALGLAMYLLSPFLAMRLPWRYLRTLAFAPGYIAWKIVVSMTGRPRQWIRTAREGSVNT